MRIWAGYQRGVNLGGWFSQCDHTEERYDSFIAEEDFARIREWGTDHVRVPVDYELLEDEKGRPRENGYRRLENAVAWCRRNGLHMILDLHKTAGFSFDDNEGEAGFFDSEAYQERFCRLSEAIARRLGRHADMLAFELLNEVTEKSYAETWNRSSRECIRRIRAIAPEVYILVGGYYHNSAVAVKDLAAPYDDRIVYNFHCYEPLILTHQGAGWVDGMPRLFRMRINSTYKEYADYARKNIASCQDCVSSFDPSARMGIEFFERLMDEAVRVAEERDVALYCGEFGVIELAEAVDTLEWYRLICTCMDKHGIGRAAWSYKQMDFGLADPHMDPVRDELLKLL